MRTNPRISVLACLLVFEMMAAAQHNVTTAGTKSDHVLKFSTSTTIVDSAITELGGKVGIGVGGSSSSTLTVNGEIQTLSGGVKFPDGTTQATAGIAAIKTDSTLQGAGTAQSPLGISLPFVESTAASGAVFTIRNANSTENTYAILGRGWGGLLGAGTGYGIEGLGPPAAGANNAGVGGPFIGGDCGGCTSATAGDGLMAAPAVAGSIAAFGENSPSSYIECAAFAAFFFGDVKVSGNVSKAGGSFQIDHPLDPGNKYLYHSFVESFRYQLTVTGQFAQAIVASKISNNQFVIRTDRPGVEVSWQVTGIRQDAWANAHRIPVEADKTAAEKGRYLHPELFGHTGEASIGELPRPR